MRQNKITEALKMLSKPELQEIRYHIDELIERQTTAEREKIEEIETCPHCGSISIRKNGKSEKVGQRYYCNDCHKTFSKATDSFMFHSKVSEQQWKQFIDYEIAKLPLREEAYFLDLSITTCYFMRHKLYRAVEKLQLNDRLEKSAQLDSAYYKINLKGTKPENMPRKSKERGSRSDYRGISHHKICVITAIDENDHIIMNIAGLGPESSDKYSLVSSKFDDVDLIISDSKTSIRQFSNRLEIENDIIRVKPAMKNYKTADDNTLADVNELISDYRISSKVYRGVATRYLQDYLNFFTYRKQLLYRFKRNEIADYVFEQIKGIVCPTQDELQATIMPVSLAEAYYEYRYGIFAEQHLS